MNRLSGSQINWFYLIRIPQNKARLGSGFSFDISIAGQYVYERNLLSDEFKAFLATFPQWAHVTAWISSYDSWKF